MGGLRNIWSRVIFAGMSVASSGCIGAAGIPGGPLQGTGATLGGSYGYALAPAEVTLQRTPDGSRSTFHDVAGDALNFPLFPARLGFRAGLTDYFDAAGDLSFLDSGFEVRGGLPEGARPIPFTVSLGVRRGAWGLLDSDNRFSHEERVRFEAYPRLGENEEFRFNLIATAGVSIGRRYHPFVMPGRYGDQRNENEEGSFGPEFKDRVLRDETRLEGSIGFEARHRRFFTSLVLMPYVVAHSSNTDGHCTSCYNWTVNDYQSNFGAALFLSAGVTFGKSRGNMARDGR
ncbi:MAG: hypothetical protein ABI548_17015 [Polyangiaceae bacterium]